MSAPLGVLDLGVLAVIWAWGLWGRATRSARTIAFLLAMTIGYLVLAAIPGQIPIVLRVALLTGGVAVLLFRSEWFMTIADADLEFDRSFWRAQQLLTKLAQQRLAGTIDRTGFANGVARVIPEFEQLSPPDEEWERLLGDTVDHLRGWVAAHMADPDSVTEDDLRVSALRARHLQIRAARTRFWR